MTTPMTSIRAFADAMSGIVGHRDPGDVLRELLENCAELYPARAVAVLVRDGRPGLELLSATSHRAEELELLQLQHDRGPCVEAISSGAPVLASGEAELVQRWGPIGEAIARHGYSPVLLIRTRSSGPWTVSRTGGGGPNEASPMSSSSPLSGGLNCLTDRRGADSRPKALPARLWP